MVRLQKDNLEGLPKGGRHPPLSAAQKEVLYLLTVERLLPAQVARRRGCTPQAIYKIRRQLVALGYLRSNYTRVEKTGIGSQPVNPGSGSFWELHGCAWRVPILEGKRGKKYVRAIGAGQARVSVRGATCELCRDVIKIHTETFFRDAHPKGAVLESWAFLWRVLAILENDYGLLLRKERHPIRRYRGHFPRLNDELARAPGAEMAVVYDEEDAKPRFLVDWSKDSFPEAEFLHAAHGEEDAEKYEEFIRDLIARESFPLSEVSQQSARATAQILALAREMEALIVATKVGAEQQRGVAAALEGLVRTLTPSPPPPAPPAPGGRPFYVG